MLPYPKTRTGNGETYSELLIFFVAGRTKLRNIQF
jgi:hypothetical protein